MTVIGYTRENYPIKFTLQKSRFEAYGCNKIFMDPRSFDEDSQLQIAISKLKRNDVLIVEMLSVFGKNLNELVQILKLLDEQGVRVVSISEILDTEKQPAFIHHLEIISKSIGEQRSEYTKQRLADYRSTGSRLGRPTISQETIDLILKLHDQKMTLRRISVECNVSLGTVHKYVNQEKELRSEKV